MNPVDIEFDRVSMKFRLYTEKVDSLKEFLLRAVKKNIRYTDFYALRSISLTIYRGDRIGIIGRNGAGKSTLLKMIAGVLKPSEGTLKVYGRVAPLLELGAGFDPELTGAENIYLNGAILGKNRLKRWREKRVIKQSGLFDEKYYFARYPDIVPGRHDPLEHFVAHGWREGRNPGEAFDTVFYLDKYPDVGAAGINPLYHYIVNGRFEGRIPKEEPEEIRISIRGDFLRRIRHFRKSSRVGLSDVFRYIRRRGFGPLVHKVVEVSSREETPRPLARPHSLYRYEAPAFDGRVAERMAKFKFRPLISILMPVYNVDPKWLRLAIESVRNQWYPHWELCIVDDGSTNEKTVRYLNQLEQGKDERIKVRRLPENLNISGASNKALEMATGEYVLLMDHDDEITVDALFEVVKAINEYGSDLIYSDEDKINPDGSHCEPHFKPDYSPDMLLSQNYICHVAAIRKTLMEKVGGFAAGLEGAQDYDLFLKIVEHTDRVTHIPKVLYHWRKIPGSTASQLSSKSYSERARIRALENAIRRRNLKASVS